MDPDVILLVASCRRESATVIVRSVYYVITVESLPPEPPGIKQHTGKKISLTQVWLLWSSSKSVTEKMLMLSLNIKGPLLKQEISQRIETPSFIEVFFCPYFFSQNNLVFYVHSKFIWSLTSNPSSLNMYSVWHMAGGRLCPLFETTEIQNLN